MSARLKLTLSYAAVIVATGVLLLTVVWVFLLRYVPEASINGNNGWAPNRHELIDAFFPKAVIAVLFLLFVGLAAGWLLAGRMLSPLHRITEVTRGTGDTELDRRVHLKGRQDEFRELADAVDTMLDRIRAHIDEERRFAANASHELRTPLATSQAILDVALRSPKRSMDADTRRDLNRLRTVTARASALTQDLLLLSRIKHDTNQVPVDMSLLLDEAEESLLPLAEHFGVNLVTNVEPGELPVVSGSASLLRQLLVNLMHNALVHNLPDHGWVTTTVACKDGPNKDAETVCLTVQNPGPVVTQTLIPQLTEPFQHGPQGRSGSRGAHVGAGLGLAIAARIVEHHHGDLDLEPRQNGGLTVQIRLSRFRQSPSPAPVGS